MNKPYDIKERRFNFTLEIVNLCRNIQKEGKEYILSKQLMHPGTAVGALIREAQNAESHKDFIHKMAIAQKECDESTYWMDLNIKSKLNDSDQVKILRIESMELLKIIRSIILNKKTNLKLHNSYFIII